MNKYKRKQFNLKYSYAEKFDEFQLSEYVNISNAHFETLKQVTTFFRFYLIIISTPSILLLFVKINNNLSGLFKGTWELSTTIFIALMFIVLSIIGILSCMHIINIRFDAILYARTVNGIRKYFYELKKLDSLKEYSLRVLPKSTNQPKYYEIENFMPIIFTFGLINSSYFTLGCYIIYTIGNRFFPLLNIPILLNLSYGHFILGFSLLLILHIVLYRYMSYRRNNIYLKSHYIGIDIDGVLNKHRNHFCKILKETRNKNLDPDKIVEIPVHFISNTNVTEEDEHYVFNQLKYWTEMPPIQQDFYFLKKMQKILGLNILIFSWRPWPDFSLIRKEKLDSKEWSNLKLLNWYKMRKITKKWLRKYDIIYDKLYIEKGSAYISNISFKFLLKKFFLLKNRFYLSNYIHFKYFVEDNPKNAIKLANFCEYVFLIKHPYNIHKDYPKNVILVESWSEIYKFICDVS